MQELNYSDTSCIALNLHQLEDRIWSPLSHLIVNGDLIKTGTSFWSELNLPADICFGILVSISLLIRTIKQPQVKENTNTVDTGQSHSLAAVTACFLLGIFATPIVMVSLPLFFSYRLLVHVYLKRRIGVRFAGLLKGPDVIWAMELPEARSIITVLIVLEGPPLDVKFRRGDSPGKHLLRTLRKIAVGSLLSPGSAFPKLARLRQKTKLGYHYWMTENEINVDKFVRCLEICENYPDGLPQTELERIIGDNCNKPMPYDDSALWEILVGQQPLLKAENSKKLFPILFRVHHSVGDGVALLRLLLEGLADRADYKSLDATAKQKLWSQSHRGTQNEESEYDNESQESTDPESIPVEPIVTFSPCSVITKDEQTKTPSTFASSVDTQVTSFKCKVKNKLRVELLKFKNSFPFVSPNVTEIKTQWTKLPAWDEGLNESSFGQFRSRRNAVDLRTAVVKTLPDSVSPPPQRLSEPVSDIGTSVWYDGVRRRASVGYPYAQKKDWPEQQYPSQSLETLEPLRSSLFEKCGSYKSTKVLGATPTKCPTEKNFSPPSMKDLAIYMIVSIMVSVVCMKRALQILLKTTLPSSIKIFKFAFFTPYILFDQMLGATEDSLLYGKKLSGEKVTAWVIEDACQEELLKSKIRLIRAKLGGSLKFTHVLFTCLSRSLHRFYLRHQNRAPSSVNVVLPARVDMDDLRKGLETTATCQLGKMRARVTRLYSPRKVLKQPFQPSNISFSSSTESEPDETQRRVEKIHSALSRPLVRCAPQLDNKFTVAMMKLPVGSVSLDRDGELLNQVQSECHRLGKAPDYLVNYWLLRWVAHLAPCPLLRPFLKGAPCSLVLSNLPGPEDDVLLARRPIKDIVFWVPNRGLNGVGIGMLSYCGRFSMGIVADKALISSQDEARKIISGVFSEVDLLLNAPNTKK